jgi:hypothetical protein
MIKFHQYIRHIVAGLLMVTTAWSSEIARAQTDVPPECFVHDVGVLILPTLRTGLISQRMQINQISTAILKNASGNHKVERWVSCTMRRHADKALERALRAVTAFPSQVIGCVEPTTCSIKSLDRKRDRIMWASRKLADDGLRLVDRYPDLLGEPAVLVREQIENRFNSFLDGLDFLPPATYVCRH